VVLPVAVAAEGEKALLMKVVLYDPLEELAAFVAEALVVGVVVDLVCVVRADQRSG